jgi:WD40 repeat protein
LAVDNSARQCAVCGADLPAAADGIRLRKPAAIAVAVVAAVVAIVVSIKLGPLGAPPGVSQESSSSVLVLRPVATVGVIKAGAFSRDGRFLATAGEGGVHVWDARTWREVSSTAVPSEVNSLAFSPDGANVAVTGNVQTWILERETGKVLRQLPVRAITAVFAADGATVRTFSLEKPAGVVTNWATASGRQLESFSGSTELAKDSPAAFSLDGTKLAVVDSGGAIKIRNGANGAEVQSVAAFGLDSSDPLRALEFSPSGATIAALQGPHASILNVAKARRVTTVSCGDDARTALAAAFSSDGARIALACDSGRGAYGVSARVFDIATDQLIFEFQDEIRNDRPVWTGFSPDGAQLVSLDNVWDTRQAAASQRGLPLEAMEALEFAADDSKVYGAGHGSGDNSNMEAAALRVWSAPDGRSIVNTTVPTTYPGIAAAAFSPDHSKVLMARGADARVFGTADGKLLFELPGNGALFRDDIGSAAFSPDGKWALTGEAYGGVHTHLLYLWDTQTGRKKRDLDLLARRIISGIFSRDSGRIIAAIDEDVIGAFDIANERWLYRIDHLNGHRGMKLSADGARLFVPFERNLQVRNSATGELVNQVALPAAIESYDVSADGSQAIVASGGEPGTAAIVNVSTGAVELSLTGHIGSIRTVGFSHDGSIVLTGGDDHTVRLWDAKDGRVLHTFEGHPGPVTTAFFSPDDTHLLAVTRDHRIWLWDVHSGRGIELL